MTKDRVTVIEKYQIKISRKLQGTSQWGRGLEGWPNTAARLADWRRVSCQVWFCTWWTGRTACLFHTDGLPWPELSSCKPMEFPAVVIKQMYTTVRRATSRKEGMTWYRPLPSCWRPLSFTPTRFLDWVLTHVSYRYLLPRGKITTRVGSLAAGKKLCYFWYTVILMDWSLFLY